MRHKPKVITACQDPGGTNAVYPVVKALKARGYDVIVCAAGHAAGILKKKNCPCVEVDLADISHVQGIVDEHAPKYVLLGTSWGNSVEDLFVTVCRKKHIFTAAVLDSWAYYKERFSDIDAGGEPKFMPDIVCAMDDYAKNEMIQAGLPADRIFVTGNPYFDDLREQAARFTQKTKESLLDKWLLESDTKIVSFFSQTIDKTFGSSAGDPRYLGYTQKDALMLLVNSLHKFVEDEKDNIALIVRPHPKEDIRMYDGMFRGDKHIAVIVSDEEDAREIMSVSDVVVSMFSILLVEAYMIGKDIISVQPNHKKDNFVLSRRGIVKTAVDEKGIYERFQMIFSGQNSVRESPVSRPANAADAVLKTIDQRMKGFIK